MVAAFLSSHLTRSVTAQTQHLLLHSPAVETVVSNALRAGALYKGAPLLADYSGAVMSYFNTIRIPAALITGSSLATLFSMLGRLAPDEMKSRTRLENRVTVLYHILSAISFLLSLTVVLTATSTSTTLLLGFPNPTADSAYHLMRRELDYEFCVTRWSFFVSLFSFLGAITMRGIMEFDLLSRKRRPLAPFVTFSVLALGFHLLSTINNSLNCWPSLFAMTVHLMQLFAIRVIKCRHPSDMAAVFSALAAVYSGVRLLQQSSAPAEVEHAGVGGENEGS